MKTNGRRAWRRLAAKQTQHEHRGSRAIDPTARSFPLWRGRASWMRRHMLETTPPVPAPRPFSVRSLIGMSMRTRRYYAAKGAIVSGDRLRPCPGCLACQHLRTCTACENAEFEGYRCENCGRVHVVQRICDGAGVLPAKRGRR